ncbi:TIR domain-containing protein [Dokdonia ponticola]|uniref:TIR domain-containing protein n=1 Tax=Dokdonia ponticola TaxID=2041041 RepID=A0ABV9HT23_9FLAO
MEESKKYNVFYSWQSDLDRNTNQNGIRQAIREAINKIELKNDELIINLDEATRNISGSPNIPKSIFQKIESSEIFICDITTINNNQEEFRKTPNPNVLIELGYAIGKLGWERIIMLFNKSKGEFPNDVPFDIDKHRIADFSINSKNDNNGKGQLRETLTEAIKLIIEQNPTKPSNKLKRSKKEIQKERDLENLEWLLGQIHIPTVDDFILTHPETFRHKVLFFWEGFNSIMINSLFTIYDEKLKKLIESFHHAWGYSLSFGILYRSPMQSDNYIFGVSDQFQPSADEDKAYILLKKNKKKLYKSFKDLMNYVKENYLEINLKETNLKAFNEYLSYQKD